LGFVARLLIRERKWRLAEEVQAKAQDRDSPHFRAQRIEILDQQAKDPSVSPGEREMAIQEIEALRELVGKMAKIEFETDGREVQDEEGVNEDSERTQDQ
jgi:hypothetical protein